MRFGIISDAQWFYPKIKSSVTFNAIGLFCLIGTMMKITTFILAAGKGTRMRSDLPKVLHKIANKPLLVHVYETARELSNTINIIVGHRAEQVKELMRGADVNWVMQAQQLGTGHAVQQASAWIDDDDRVLILFGDVPLLKPVTAQKLIVDANEKRLALLTVELDDPKGYGRIIRDDNGRVVKIVEDKDASAIEKQITEINTGIMAVQGGLLKTWLTRLDNDNAQGEYYLTDVVAMAVADGVDIITSQPTNPDEVLGVNNRFQLAHLERVYQQQQAHWMMAQGVTLRDPSRFDLRGKIIGIGEDVDIDINVIFEGDNTIGNRVRIGPNTIIKNAEIGDDVEILAQCVIEDAVIGSGCRIGPFARIRPETVLANDVHIGNFVEIKKSSIDSSTKINHLSYIGDAEVGKKVNIGAGTITCNYDGVNKSKTIIEDGAFIGSNSQLVAPVTIGNNATIGAGSTITKNAPAEQLTLSRAQQISIPGWLRPVKREK